MLDEPVVPGDIVTSHSGTRHPSPWRFRGILEVTGRTSGGGEAMRPIKDRAVVSLSSAAGPVTKQMVVEACDTLIREKHPASPPEWPKDTGSG